MLLIVGHPILVFMQFNSKITRKSTQKLNRNSQTRRKTLQIFIDQKIISIIMLENKKKLILEKGIHQTRHKSSFVYMQCILTDTKLSFP